MFFKAKEKYCINMNLSWMIGDNETDILAANRAGINNTILFKTGSHKTQSETKARHVIEFIYQTKNLITL